MKKYFLFSLTLIAVVFIVYSSSEKVAIEYYKTGEKKIRIIQTENGNEYTYYFRNGNIKKAFHLLNKNIDGAYLQFYETGELKDSVYYDNGVIISDSYSFYQDGTLLSKSSYTEDNVIDGTCFSYFKTGQLQAINVFVDGHMYYAKAYSEGDSIRFREKILPEIILSDTKIEPGDTLTVITKLFDLLDVPYSSKELLVKYDFAVQNIDRKYDIPKIVINSKIDTSKYIIYDTTAVALHGFVSKKNEIDTIFENASFFEHTIEI